MGNELKASDLRIGNLVIDGREVVNVNSRMIGMLEKDEADFDPIPLTKERLLKFGFKHGNNSPDGSAIGKGGVYLGCMHGGRFCFNAESSTNKAVYIKYIHQLQNLYFALTGEELDIKKQTFND